MVNVDCAGGQDRNITTSETHPNIPPRKTRNCYLSDPLNTGIGFDRSLCGTNSDRACSGIAGGINACEPDNYGGYCKNNNQYFVSKGNIYAPLTQADLINKYKDSSNIDQSADVNIIWTNGRDTICRNCKDLVLMPFVNTEYQIITIKKVIKK